jgi:hypothetical protein
MHSVRCSHQKSREEPQSNVRHDPQAGAYECARAGRLWTSYERSAEESAVEQAATSHAARSGARPPCPADTTQTSEVAMALLPKQDSFRDTAR